MECYIEFSEFWFFSMVRPKLIRSLQVKRKTANYRELEKHLVMEPKGTNQYGVTMEERMTKNQCTERVN